MGGGYSRGRRRGGRGRGWGYGGYTPYWRPHLLVPGPLGWGYFILDNEGGEAEEDCGLVYANTANSEYNNERYVDSNDMTKLLGNNTYHYTYHKRSVEIYG